MRLSLAWMTTEWPNDWSSTTRWLSSQVNLERVLSIATRKKCYTRCMLMIYGILVCWSPREESFIHACLRNLLYAFSRRYDTAYNYQISLSQWPWLSIGIDTRCCRLEEKLLRNALLSLPVTIVSCWCSSTNLRAKYDCLACSVSPRQAAVFSFFGSIVRCFCQTALACCIFRRHHNWVI